MKRALSIVSSLAVALSFAAPLSAQTQAPTRTAVRAPISPSLVAAPAALIVGPTPDCPAPQGYNQIRTVADLLSISNNLTASYFLCNDLNMTGVSTQGIGGPVGNCYLHEGADYEPIAFKGIFEGNNRTISNLTITFHTCVGLFKANSGVVKNLRLATPAISTPGFGSMIGTVAGRNRGNIFNVQVINGSLRTGNSHSGGLVGFNDGGFILNASVTGTAIRYGTGQVFIGGIAGVNSGAIARASSTATIAGTPPDYYGGDWTGGLIGWNIYNPVYKWSVLDSYTGGSIQSNAGGAAGLIAFNDDNGYYSGYPGHTKGGNIKNTYSTTALSVPYSTVSQSLIGYAGLPATIQSGHFNSEINPSLSNTNGVGHTTAQMKTYPSSFYPGFDFTNAWQQTNGQYPTLRPFPSCIGDMNADRLIDIRDLSILATNWNLNVTPYTSGDVNGDGYVDNYDLTFLAISWSTACPV